MTDFAPAVHALYCLTARHGGWLELECQNGTERVTIHHRCDSIRDAGRLAERVRMLSDRLNHEVTMSLPRPQRGWGSAMPSTVLWCRIEGSDQQARARRFKPFPSMVLREGQTTRRLLIWALSERLAWDRCKDFNRRIAYALRAVQKHADPDTLQIGLPGTLLHVGRSRPVPIVVDRLRADFYEADWVAGRLRTPPEQTWRAA